MRWLLCLFCLAAHADPLPALRAQAEGVTVSGVSSGGFMAVQLHVAHSASVSGAGAIAGGPYYCAQGSLFAAMYNCMAPGWWTPLPPLQLLKARTDSLSEARRIDPARGLAGAPVWLFSGTNDHAVKPEVVQALRAYYTAYRAKVELVADKPAGHAMVTDDRGGPCAHTEAPFIVDCDYDAAGALLAHLLGKLEPRARSETGKLLRFDQNDYAEAKAISLDETGFVYVPAACTGGGCRVHVAFHGCRQGASEVGERFVRDAGYNRWADTNRLIVLYPQAIKRYSFFTFNPRGCWDWWGYTGADYATRSGAQMRAVKAMLERLSAS